MFSIRACALVLPSLSLALGLVACGDSGRPVVAVTPPPVVTPPTNPPPASEPPRTFASTVKSDNRDAELLPQVGLMQTQGCDPLDPAHCLYPFPSNQFTTAAVAGCPQDAAQGGTGLRVNFNPAGMPHNAAGKPIDPTEWNRNDGFSPGAMIVTMVPGIAKLENGSLKDAPPIGDPGQSLSPNATVFVMDADTGEKHLVWAEYDLQSNLFLHQEGEEIPQPQDYEGAVIIRPAKNFVDGHRYIVALRGIADDSGALLTPSAAFAACRGDYASSLLDVPAFQTRCDKVQANLKALQDKAGVDPATLYLAWDFTVQSTAQQVGRLLHMRDDAFGSLGETMDKLPGAPGYAMGNAPGFTITEVKTEGLKEGIARLVSGTLSVPSYVTSINNLPAARQAYLTFAASLPEELSDVRDVAQILAGANAPANHLVYTPDGSCTDPSQALYGDGKPDRLGGIASMDVPFVCEIPTSALTTPARAGIYGHGLLDSRQAVTYDGVPELSREHNMLWCAVDWFGFATGDVGNVLTTLSDVSLFRVVPDGSQQGMLNFLFLARALKHPDGFAANDAFKADGNAVFDTRHIYYDGNSQGGILGGVVMSMTRDIERGVLGSLGMNYSTLLQRSTDFIEAVYSVPLFTAYQNPYDRLFVYSFIQMLWDRSENNGYANHLNPASPLPNTPVKTIKLDTMFGDHQVTMWSAQVMARTMGAMVDDSQIEATRRKLGQAQRQPDAVPYFAMPRSDYADRSKDNQSLFVVWDVLEGEGGRTAAEIPPTGNNRPNQGRDPHDDSAKVAAGRCQKSLFFQPTGLGRYVDSASLDTPEKCIAAFGVVPAAP